MAISDSQDPPRAEYAALVRAFRLRLEAYQRSGVALIPGGPSPTPAFVRELGSAESSDVVRSGATSEDRPVPIHESAHAAENERSAALPEQALQVRGQRTSLADARSEADTWAEGDDGRPSVPAEWPQTSSAESNNSQPVPGGRAAKLAAVRAELGDCQRCKLAAGRNHIVFGVGDPEASLMFVGEAPGANEDRLGEPFVGAAGQLLDKMIEAMGWQRSAVYIANVVKCRPPRNRTPEHDEIRTCKPFLAKQIDIIGPRIIVALGRPAAQLLLETNASISSLRGTFHRYRGTAVMPTFHPAFLLRNPERKRDTWNDLKLVITELERLGVPAPRLSRR